MVAPSSELANIVYISSQNLQIPQHRVTDSTMDINMEDTRGHSLSSSQNSSRESSTHSNASSMNNAEKLQAQVNKPSWAEQVDIESPDLPILSYATIREEETVSANQAPASTPIHTPHAADSPNNVPHSEDSNNTFPPQGMEPLVIPYSINQPVDPQLWNGNFCPVSPFGTNEYLEGDSKNIVCSLRRIAAFIKQHKLEGKNIASFSLTTVLYDSAYKRISKYIIFHFIYCITTFTNGSTTIHNGHGC